MDLTNKLISTLQDLVKDRAPQKSKKALSQNNQTNPVIAKKDEPKIASVQDVTAYIKGLEVDIPGRIVNEFVS